MSAIAADVLPKPRDWSWVFPWVSGLIMTMGLLILRSSGSSDPSDPPEETASSCAELSNPVHILAGGSGDGSSWSSPLDDLPTTLTRGVPYYVGDGSYSSYTFDTAESSETFIYICKASASDHGSDTGWDGAFGDGQATFGGFTFDDSGTGNGHVVIDGAYRDEDDWNDGSAYGFKIPGVSSRTDGGDCADSVTIRYADLSIGTGVGNESTNSSIDAVGFDDRCEDWLVDRVRVAYHIRFTAALLYNVEDFTIQYSLFADSLGKEAIRGRANWIRVILRWNRFHNACGDGMVEADEACTGEIASWGDTGTWTDNEIYGNSFFENRGHIRTGGTIIVGGDGSGWPGSPASNTLVYNNTFAMNDIDNFSDGLILVNGGSGNVCRNNLRYETTSTSSSCNTTSNDVTAVADPFVGYATGDLRLSGATTAGFALSSPYDEDMLGVTRGADGNWDVGAFEFEAN